MTSHLKTQNQIFEDGPVKKAPSVIGRFKQSGIGESVSFFNLLQLKYFTLLFLTIQPFFLSFVLTGNTRRGVFQELNILLH